jgi:hypothetical protein
MSIPGFSPFPPIPQRSTPEADFDAKMYALFQHFATTHRNELLAFIDFLETNSTVIGAALNGTTIGLTTPAAAKFTDLEADSISGAAVQASSNDATPGKVMKVGAFGLGDAALETINADVFDPSATGLSYTISAGSGGAADTPNAAWNWNILKFQRSGGYQAALVIRQTGGAPQAYIGTYHDGVQGPWARLLHSENVVGPVSQDAGKVTGAVVQSGSGPGGHFRRFADGTQECWVVSPEVVADTQVGSRYISADGWEWDFPAEFISTPTIHATARRWTGPHAHGAMIGSGGFGVNGCRLLLSTEFEGSSGFLHGYAIGRWY